MTTELTENEARILQLAIQKLAEYRLKALEIAIDELGFGDRMDSVYPEPDGYKIVGTRETE